MPDVVEEATCITPSTETLTDVIAATKLGLVKKTGVLLLDITDHSCALVNYYAIEISSS